jgi:hypothetical protein
MIRCPREVRYEELAVTEAAHGLVARIIPSSPQHLHLREEARAHHRVAARVDRAAQERRRRIEDR